MNQAVSIIIPVYKTDPYVVIQAIQSALIQLDVHKEVIVVNDGYNTSPDEVYISCFKKCGLFDKIKFLSYPENKGVGCAWDYGIQKSTCPFISPLASDDLFFPEKTILQLTVMNKEQAAFSYTGYRVLQYPGELRSSSIVTVTEHISHGVKNHDGELMFKELTKNNFRNCFINGATVVFTKELYDKVGGYDHGLRYTQDFDLWLKMCKHSKMLCISNILMLRRQHTKQTRNIFRSTPNSEEIRHQIEHKLIKERWGYKI